MFLTRFLPVLGWHVRVERGVPGEKAADDGGQGGDGHCGDD